MLLETDWSINGFTGCPTPNPLGLSLQCNDGSGALVTVGFCVNFLGYDVELSMPFDGSFTLPLNVGPNPTTNALQNNGRPRLMSLNRTGGMDSMQVHVDPPVIQHHCLPDTLGFAAFQVPDTGCPELACDTFVPPTLVRGGLYTSTQPCSATDARPAILARASWTPVALDGSGNANVMMPTAPSGQCNYLGTSTNAGAGETPNITGFVVVGGPTAASPIAEAVRAVRKGGSVEVTFRTSSELGLLGFNIYAAGKAKGGEIKLNDTLIQATGAGGAGSQYSLSYALASLKGNRGIIVESVLTDTSTVRAPRVEF